MAGRARDTSVERLRVEGFEVTRETVVHGAGIELDVGGSLVDRAWEGLPEVAAGQISARGEKACGVSVQVGDDPVAIEADDPVGGDLEDLPELAFAFAFPLVGASAFGDVAGHAEPLADVAGVVQQGNGAGQGPAEAAVGLEDAMLQFEDASGADGLRDGGQDTRLIFGVDVLPEPVSIGLLGFGEETAILHAALELVHLASVGAHAVHGVGAGGHQGAEMLLVLVEGVVGDVGVLRVGRLRMSFDLPG